MSLSMFLPRKDFKAVHIVTVVFTLLAIIKNIDKEKYLKFETLVKNNNSSIYASINKYIDDYIESNQ